MEFEIEENYLNPISNNEYSKEQLTFPVLEAQDLSYSQFFNDFMVKNLPCLIKNVGNEWEASTKWAKDQKPDLVYLNDKYKDTNVIIYNCSERYFNSQKCTEGRLTDYLNNLKEDNNNLYYLKDWHLKLQCKNDSFYQVPIYFASDWLNEYFIQCTNDDYRFVYMGQKGTWTPLHADVFNSYSWSVNICGQKKWIFFPPGEELFLKDNLNNIPYDIHEVTQSRKSFEVIQNPGEAVFVPSGWYHQVWNLQDTISINHNWVNGCNINKMWQSLKSNLQMTRKEIDDCKEMDNFEDHCQVMVKVLFGIDYEQFYEFLCFMAKRLLEMVNCPEKRILYHGHAMGIKHILFDLSQVRNVLEDFLNCDDICKINHDCNGQSLLTTIVQILENGNRYL